MFDVNDKILFALAGLVILFVLGQSVLFFLIAFKRAKELNMDMKKLRSVLIGTGIFTIAPAISILIGLISLSKFLGLPLPWLRLSVVGALTYELPAATTSANAMGVSLNETITDPVVYSTIAWVMTLGIMAGIFIITFWLRKIESGLIKIKGTDQKWGDIFMDSLFLGMISAFLGMIFSDVHLGMVGFIPVVVMVVSSLIMLVCGYFIKFKNQAWLENYALPVSMISSMLLSIPITHLMGGV